MKKHYARPWVSVVVAEAPTLLVNSGPGKKKFTVDVFEHDDQEKLDNALKSWTEIKEENPDEID